MDDMNNTVYTTYMDGTVWTIPPLTHGPSQPSQHSRRRAMGTNGSKRPPACRAWPRTIPRGSSPPGNGGWCGHLLVGKVWEIDGNRWEITGTWWTYMENIWEHIGNMMIIHWTRNPQFQTQPCFYHVWCGHFRFKPWLFGDWTIQHLDVLQYLR